MTNCGSAILSSIELKELFKGSFIALQGLVEVASIVKFLAVGQCPKPSFYSNASYFHRATGGASGQPEHCEEVKKAHLKSFLCG